MPTLSMDRAQRRSMEQSEAASATKLPGAVGGVVSGVVTQTGLLGSERLPAASSAWTV